MEVYAGFAEHVDHEVGRLVDEIERPRLRRQHADLLHLGRQRRLGGRPERHDQRAAGAERHSLHDPISTSRPSNQLGGLDVLGSPKTDNMYHAGWAWAGSTPYKGTKLLASHFGGTRNPMAVRWPAQIKPDPTPRSQFHHVNDMVPTIYEVLGITPPRVVNGIPQDPIDGVSFAYTFNDAKAKGRKRTQYFEIMGSRAIYHDGWMASAFGPRMPWVPGSPPGIREWTPDKDKWELYNLDDDWSQANDLADKMPREAGGHEGPVPDRVREEQVLSHRRRSLGSRLPPRAAEVSTPYTEWTFPGEITRMPEFCAPALGNKPNVVTIDAEIPDNANGVLYALGGFSGGLSLYVKDGMLSYEYNLFEIQRTHIRAKEKLPAGKVKIEVETSYVDTQAGRSAQGRHEGQRQGSRLRRRSGQRAAAVHRQRLPRHRHRPRLAGFGGLLRQGAVQVQRQDRACSRQVRRFPVALREPARQCDLRGHCTVNALARMV